MGSWRKSCDLRSGLPPSLRSSGPSCACRNCRDSAAWRGDRGSFASGKFCADGDGGPDAASAADRHWGSHSMRGAWARRTAALGWAISGVSGPLGGRGSGGLQNSFGAPVRFRRTEPDPPGLPKRSADFILDCGAKAEVGIAARGAIQDGGGPVSAGRERDRRTVCFRDFGHNAGGKSSFSRIHDASCPGLPARWGAESRTETTGRAPASRRYPESGRPDGGRRVRGPASSR